MTSPFKLYWNVFMIILMVYVSIYAPFEIAFFSDNPKEPYYEYNLYSGLLVDFLFFIDMIINFLSSYEIENGREETNLRTIACSYLQGWFWIDLFATLPT